MKSRKLRALALLLSAIMIITAVPSTLFAFESVDGEVVGWDQETEAPAEVPADFGLGFDYEVEEAPLVAEDFDFFAADELVATDNDIEYEHWDLVNKTVAIKFLASDEKVYSLAAGEVSEVVSPTDCTESFLTATIKDAAGVEHVFYSNVCKPGTTWEMKIDDTVIFRSTGAGATAADNATANDKGVFKNGNKHQWVAVDPIPEEDIVESNCIQTVYYASYKCSVCGMITYDNKNLTEKVVKTANTPQTTVKGQGHKLPDASLIKYSYIVNATENEANSQTLKNEPVVTGDQGTVYYVYNSQSVNNNEPTPVKTEKDAKWIVVKEYECAVCHEQIKEYSQGEKLIRKIAYKNLKNVTSTLSSVTIAETKETYYLGTNSWEADKDKFSLVNCVDPTTKAEKNGSYDEVWYVGDLTKDTVFHPVTTHVIPYHGNTATIFKTVANGKLLKVTNNPESSLLTTDLTDLEKSFLLSYANGKKKADADRKANGVTSSLSCVTMDYYEVVQCKDCKRILSVTKKTAPGNDAAHKYSEGVTYLINNAPVAPAKYTKKILDDAAKKGGVTYENATYDCVNDGTVDVYYTCPMCKKSGIFYKTINVEHPGHDFVWVDIEPKKDPTCTEDGFVTQQSQCSVCKIANPGEKIRTATLPKLNHPGVDKEKAFYVSVANGGDIVGNNWTDKSAFDDLSGVDPIQGKTYENKKVVNARVYKICPVCGKPVYDSNKANAVETDKEYNWGKTIDYKITSLTKKSSRCSNGTITVKASINGLTPEVAAEGSYDYWNNINAYQARTNHTAVAQPDGSVICAVCGEVLAAAPVITTVAPTTVEPTTVVTTEAPTTVAPTTAAPTTVEPTTVVTTVAPTTVPPVVEPTTEITTVEPATMPAQVTGEKVTKNSPTTGMIGVKYNAVEGADSYTVNVREPNGTWTKNPTNGAETAFEITGLTEGKCYDIRIAAVAAGIAGPRSGHLYRWLKKVTLMKPTKIKGEAGAVNVTWDAADGASKYKLYVSSDKAFKQDVKKIKATENTAKVTGLKAGTKYYFKVRCYTKGADGVTYTGGWSNVRSKTLQ